MTEGDRAGSFLTGRRSHLLFLLVLLLRITVAAQFRGNYDSQSFVYAADAAAHGENVYAATTRYNYSPLWAYVLAALWLAAAQNTSLFVLLVGLLQVAIDVVSAFLLLRIAERRLGFDAASARRAALLFFSNPLSVLVSGAQGQFDGASVLCLLAALYAATDPAPAGRRGRVVGFLTLANLVKHATAFHPLLFWKRVRPGGLSDAAAAVPYAVFFLSFLPFAGAGGEIVRNVFLYSAGVERGAARPGGLQRFLGFGAGAPVAFTVVFGLAIVWIVWMTRKSDLVRASLVLFLGLLVFLPSFSPQYLVWPVALGSLFPSAALALYSTAGALWHSSGSLELSWPIQAEPYAAWVAALVWFALEIRDLPRRLA
jgi:hypothetical protein